MVDIPLDMSNDEIKKIEKAGVKIHKIDATHGKIKIKVEKV